MLQQRVLEGGWRSTVTGEGIRGGVGSVVRGEGIIRGGREGSCYMGRYCQKVEGCQLLQGRVLSEGRRRSVTEEGIRGWIEVSC